MATYVAKRSLPGIAPDQLTAAAESAKRTPAQMTAEGTPVRYLRSTFLPGEERCVCLFEGASAGPSAPPTSGRGSPTTA